MRKSFTKFSYSSYAASPSPFVSFTSSFSTSSSGRGRGRGSIPPPLIFHSNREDHSPSLSPSPSQNQNPRGGGGGGFDRGYGGKSLPSNPIPPPLPPSLGFGRGRGLGGLGSAGPIPTQPTPPPQLSSPNPTWKSPSPVTSPVAQNASVPGHRLRDPEESLLPSSILSALSGGAGRGRGRGKAPNTPPSSVVVPDKPKEENRHIRAKPPPPPLGSGGDAAPPRPQPRFSEDEPEPVRTRGGGYAAATARGGTGGGRASTRGGGPGRGRGFQPWKDRGSGGRGRATDRVDRSSEEEDDDDDDSRTGLYLGNDADGERLAKRLGPDRMNVLAEAFEEVASRVLPDPMEDAIIDAMDINYSIECEPEYMMADFHSNPDIDDTPPMPLRDALEKAKPFLMAYENIQSQEEWEEVIEETMKNVPLMKEIVDHYSGPDRVTAMQQHHELERVAKMLPNRAHASLKRFTNNAILSLQSNPGWGFDKKCQFMDKIVAEVSRHCK